MKAGLRIALACLLLGACEDERTTSISLVRIDPPIAERCETPASARSLIAIAMGNFQPLAVDVSPTERTVLNRFPETAREFELQILGAGGALLQIGRTGEIERTEESIPIFTAAPRSVCPVGALSERRAWPVVVSHPDGVLTLAGTTNILGDIPARGAEFYEPQKGLFATLDGAPLISDLRGARGIAIGSQILLVWDNGYQIFDTLTRTFSQPTIPIGIARLRNRAHLISLADGQVAALGGCRTAVTTDTTACEASTETAGYSPDLEAWTELPALGVARAAGTALVNQSGEVWLIGGTDESGQPSTTIERWSPENGSIGSLNLNAQNAVGLPGGGALLITYNDVLDETELDLIPPIGSKIVPAGRTLGRVERAVGFSDGTVLLINEDGALENLWNPDGVVENYGSSQLLKGSGLALLQDGTLLAIGGLDTSDVPQAKAQLLRHAPSTCLESRAGDCLSGRWSNVRAQVFVDGLNQLAPGDLDGVEILNEPPRLRLTSSWDDSASNGWLRLAGPEYLAFELQATVQAEPTVGLALLFGWHGNSFFTLELVPNRPVVLRRHQDGTAKTLCTAKVLPPNALRGSNGSVDVAIELRSNELRARVSNEEFLSCSGFQPEIGAIGLGVVGALGKAITFDAVIVSRPG